MRKRYLMLGAAVALVTLIFNSTSCGMACTLIGCDSGLRVFLTGNVPTGGRVSAAADGLTPRTVDCPANRPCSEMFFRDLTPARVSITVESGGSSITRTFNPSYQTFQPNGKDCDPTCRIANIEVSL